MGLHVLDDPSLVCRNRQLVAESLGPVNNWVVGEQVHGNRVAVVDETHRGAGGFDVASAIQDTDALVTSSPDVVLLTLAADCVPMLFYDTIAGVIGVAHAGWRGTALGVAANTVRTMCDEFGARPETIQVALGPHIKSCCYEVDERVKQSFCEQYGTQPSWFEPTRDKHYQLDLGKANESIVLNCGILPHHIDIHPLCTSCHRKLFFSHRAEGKTGRLAGIISLKR